MQVLLENTFRNFRMMYYKAKGIAVYQDNTDGGGGGGTEGCKIFIFYFYPKIVVCQCKQVDFFFLYSIF